MNPNRPFLHTPRDAAPLAAFRILFGALMAFEALASYLHKVPDRYAPDMFHFTYPGFHWVAPPPGIGIYLVIILMGAAAFCVTVGYRYRLATGAFLLTYTYVFLIERAAYNNHYYLIILLAFLFLITDAHTAAAADTRRLPVERRGWIPAWQLYLFRAQIVLVYFFGGIAKLSPDWLQRQPITQWLDARADVLAIGPVLEMAFVPYLMAYGGLVFDLSIGFLLLWRKTRPAAVVMVLLFHLTNAYIFSIGVFPWLGIGATVLFLDADRVRYVLHRLGYAARHVIIPDTTPLSRRRRAWVAPVCILYLAIQLCLPLRHWYYPGDVNWTEEGHDFAWHMKLRGKTGAIRYHVVDRVTGKEDWIDDAELKSMLTNKQWRRFRGRPELIAQYARHLRDLYQQKGYADPAVYADTLVSLNGRPPQPLVNPHADLASVSTEPLRPSPWITALDGDGRPGVYRGQPRLARGDPGVAPD